MSESKPKIRMPKEFENILSKPIPIDPLEWFELKAELTRLKELNREMVEALKAVTDNYYDDYTLPKPVVLHVRKVLRKARGEGE